ncbi:hypothetical protein EJO66_31330 [Variovorax beijingensis]|uniref:DUF6351 domain-containing protein n=1 Tax=Variovorax beijingensis TaxID=2496117 RepID=A0ABX9ZWX9_9BURK|nr:DUF6351 family protein [Variovorax beijingensis]RSZ28751.1 hypothetical protein EJO66_31330 [Variovorax beijingensis]
MFNRSFARLAAGASCVLMALAGCGGGGGGSSPLVTIPPPSSDAQPIFTASSIQVLSSKSEMVTGGNAVVDISLPEGIGASQVAVTSNGTAVPNADLQISETGTLRGLITGLKDGQNELQARYIPTGALVASVKVKNSPSAGPIFSGPHQRPWICETQASGLGAPPATGPCQVEPRYDWYYKNTSGIFVPLPSLARPFPADLAQTATIDNRTVDYIVRVESGTINESIYRIAILDDPTNPTSKPWAREGKKPGPGWNGKLYMHFTGGAAPAYRSGSNDVSAPWRLSDSIISNKDDPLALGFAVAIATRFTFGTGQNDVVSAESAAMMKEHFIETYGLPKFTIGLGPSGASMQLHLIAQNYPGIFDGIIPDRSFPDNFSILGDVVDCALLQNYYTTKTTATWDVSKRAAVDGHGKTAMQTACTTWLTYSTQWQDPAKGFSAVVPASIRYNATTNPTGLRGDIWTSNINSFGTDPATGFARNGFDNVGIQYGLQALNAGQITTEEFLDLNEKVGGLDIDGKYVATRSSGNLTAIENAYRTGRMNSSSNLTLPIINYRSYIDDKADVHSFHRTFATMERLIKANGTRDNMAVWVIPGTGTANNPNLIRLGVTTMNEWLEKIAADKSPTPYAKKVIANRPDSATDACWDTNGRRINEPWTTAGALGRQTTCAQLYPVNGDVRLAAGGPRTGDILKCQLKPVNAAEYRVSFTPVELDRLNAIFPSGVCDWSKPGLNQVKPDADWLVFGEVPGTWSGLAQ